MKKTHSSNQIKGKAYAEYLKKESARTQATYWANVQRNRRKPSDTKTPLFSV